jgi:hypothetical protein
MEIAESYCFWVLASATPTAIVICASGTDGEVPWKEQSTT